MSSAYLVIFFSISPPWVSCSTFIVGANSLVTESSCKSPLYNRASSPSPPTVCPSYRRFWCWHLAGGTSHLLLPQELDLILAPCWVLVAASLSLRLLSVFFFFFLELLYCFSTWTKQVLEYSFSAWVEVFGIYGTLPCPWQLADIWCLMNQHASFCTVSTIHFLFLAHFSLRLCNFFKTSIFFSFVLFVFFIFWVGFFVHKQVVYVLKDTVNTLVIILQNERLFSLQRFLVHTALNL